MTSLPPQIHKATLSARGAARTRFEPGCVVAVKVRHPGVDATMQRDFALMQRAALLSTRVPFLAQLNLEVSVRTSLSGCPAASACQGMPTASNSMCLHVMQQHLPLPRQPASQVHSSAYQVVMVVMWSPLPTVS